MKLRKQTISGKGQMGETELDSLLYPPPKGVGFRLKATGREDILSERNSIY